MIWHETAIYVTKAEHEHIVVSILGTATIAFDRPVKWHVIAHAKHHAFDRLMSTGWVLLNRRQNMVEHLRPHFWMIDEKYMVNIYGSVMAVSRIDCLLRSLRLRNNYGTVNRRRRQGNSKVAVCVLNWSACSCFVLNLCELDNENAACSLQQVHQPDWVQRNAIINNKKLWNACQHTQTACVHFFLRLAYGVRSSPAVGHMHHSHAPSIIYWNFCVWSFSFRSCAHTKNTIAFSLCILRVQLS